MSEWRKYFKNYIIKSIKERVGIIYDPNKINVVELKIEKVNKKLLKQFSLEQLYDLYSYFMMEEDFKNLKKVDKELKERDVYVKIESNESNKTATIDFFYQDKKIQTIYMNIYSGCMVVDFDKMDYLKDENFQF